MGPKPPEELSSWKEIATYLRVGVRTAQKWETERGLPVRRLPGGRGLVSIAVKDLEAWRNSANGAAGLPEAEFPAKRFRQAGWWMAGIAALAGAVALWWLPRGPSPAKGRIEQDLFIVSDDQGHELWRKSFPSISASWHKGGRNIWIGDLDGDGRSEVLFAPSAGATGTVAGPLFCYSSDGREKWRFTPGKMVSTAEERFDPPFSVYGVAAGRLGKDGQMRVVVSSGHYLYYPAQIVILNAKGQLEREFWHAGHIWFMLVTDLRGKGKNELLLAGVNNASKRATLIVLDTDAPGGALREDNPNYQIQDMPLANETARLLFPRSCMNELLEPFAQTEAMWREVDGIAVVVRHHHLGAALYYHLNNDLTLKSLRVGSSFESAHHSLHSAGTLDHILNDAEIAALREIAYSTPGKR